MKRYVYNEQQTAAAEALRAKILGLKGVLRQNADGGFPSYKPKKRIVTAAILDRLSFLPQDPMKNPPQLGAGYAEITAALAALPVATSSLASIETLRYPGEDAPQLFLDLKNSDIVADAIDRAGSQIAPQGSYLVIESVDVARPLSIAFPTTKWTAVLAEPEQRAWARGAFPTIEFISEAEISGLPSTSFDGVVAYSPFHGEPDDGALLLKTLHRLVKPEGFALIGGAGYAELMHGLDQRRRTIQFFKRCFQELREIGFSSGAKKSADPSSPPKNRNIYFSPKWMKKNAAGTGWTIKFSRNRCYRDRKDLYFLVRQ